MSSSHLQPRRRPAASGSSTTTSTTTPSDHFFTAPNSDVNSYLAKGATFTTPKSASRKDDPTLNIQTIPHRSPTSPEQLENLVLTAESRVNKSIAQSIALDESLARAFAGVNIKDKDVPTYFTDHYDIEQYKKDTIKGLADAEGILAAGLDYDHDLDADSGLGSSICSSPRSACDKLDILQRDDATLAATEANHRRQVRKASVYGDTRKSSSSHSSLHTAVPTKSPITNYGAEKIRSLIINPILAERRLARFHPIVEGILPRIEKESITCLRDVEKTLIFQAPSKSATPKDYAIFCETSIQHIHTAVEYLNEKDQVRPTDRPYDNRYFIDLVEQVRQYACIMAATKKKQNEGKPLSKFDYSPHERVSLRGDPAKGKAPELVREKDGEVIPINADQIEVPTIKSPVVDDDVRRSMARKRKCDQGKIDYRSCRECGKVFTRPCDLTKHEKTHSRPWKCSERGCKYYDLGWPTEKERDRHVNDKHSDAPALYKCLFEGCSYTSKRESNCKQHMEKAHNWTYVRSKAQRSKVTLPTVQQNHGQSGAAAPNQSPAAASGSIQSDFGTPLSSNNNAFSPAPSIDSAGFMAPSTIGSTGFSDGGFDMNNQMDFTLGQSISPEYNSSNGISPFTNSTGNAGQFDFAGGEFEYDFSAQWPAPEEHFTLYTNPSHEQIQQPTPAWSDQDMFAKQMDTSDATNAGQQQGNAALLMTPGAHGDLMFSDNFGNAMGNDWSLGGNNQSDNQAGPLFDNLEGQSPGASGPMFADLGSIGGQFTTATDEHDPMFADMDVGMGNISSPSETN